MASIRIIIRKGIGLDEIKNVFVIGGSGVNTGVIEIAKILKKHYKDRSKIKITDDFRIGDIAVNLRAGSKTYRKWCGLEQTEKTRNNS